MSNPTLQKSFTAGAAISPYTIVKFSAASTVVPAAAVSDSLIGISNEVGPAINERCDVVMAGVAFVTASAAFSLGALLTSDASGRAAAAAPAAGTNNRIIATALEAATATGDVVQVLITPGSFQG